VRVICLIVVFFSGFNAALNLLALKYSENMPANVRGEWLEVAGALVTAFLFGAYAISNTRA